MANKALNQVSQVQSTELANVKTFLAVMNNGEIKQMSKEDMSAVVGGLFSSGKMWSFPSKDNTTLDDCNNARNGVYRFPDTKNMPREFQRNEGAIIVARPVNNIISMQECYFQNGDFYTRVEWGTGLWSSWIKH